MILNLILCIHRSPRVCNLVVIQINHNVSAAWEFTNNHALLYLTKLLLPGLERCLAMRTMTVVNNYKLHAKQSFLL